MQAFTYTIHQLIVLWPFLIENAHLVHTQMKNPRKYATHKKKITNQNIIEYLCSQKLRENYQHISFSITMIFYILFHNFAFLSRLYSFVFFSFLLFRFWFLLTYRKNIIIIINILVTRKSARVAKRNFSNSTHKKKEILWRQSSVWTMNNNIGAYRLLIRILDTHIFSLFLFQFRFFFFLFSTFPIPLPHPTEKSLWKISSFVSCNIIIFSLFCNKKAVEGEHAWDWKIMFCHSYNNTLCIKKRTLNISS